MNEESFITNCSRIVKISCIFSSSRVPDFICSETYNVRFLKLLVRNTNWNPHWSKIQDDSYFEFSIIEHISYTNLDINLVWCACFLFLFKIFKVINSIYKIICFNDIEFMWKIENNRLQSCKLQDRVMISCYYGKNETSKLLRKIWKLICLICQVYV